MKKRKKVFPPEPDIYTYSESRTNNGNKKITRWYKNGQLTNVFGYPISQSDLPISGPKVTDPYFKKNGKRKEYKYLSAGYQPGMSSSQLLSYNLREYKLRIRQYERFAYLKKNLQDKLKKKTIKDYNTYIQLYNQLYNSLPYHT